MAIQNRRGNYSDFDPSKMVEGEFAVVKSGDPNTDDGTSVYISTATGTAKRIALYQDIVQEVQGATQEIAEELTTEINEGVAENVTAAQTAATNAQTAAETATQKAQAASESAEQAAETVQNIVDNTLTQSGKAADSKETGDRIADLKADLSESVSDLKSDFSDLESDGVAPSAEQLLSKNTTADAAPYLFRQTGGDGADREYVDAIVGGTVNWNQLAKPFTSDYWSAENNVSVAFADSVATFTSQTANNGIKSNAQKQVAASHVYYMGFSFQSESASTITCFYGGNGGVRVLFNSETSMTGVYKIAKADASASGSIIYFFPSASGVNIEHKVKNAMLIDLTAMFGDPTIADYIYSLETATAGAGVAWLKAHFPRIFDAGYIPYNAGTLEHVSGLSAHRTIGFNQWDEEWELGTYNGTTGEKVTYNSCIRSRNAIRCFPSTNYYVPLVTGGFYLFYYDANGNYIGNGLAGAGIFQMPSNAHQIRFRLDASYGTTYNHDICINLSDPTKNGTYEPYKAHSYPLDSTVELRGIPKLDSNNKLYFDGDVYEYTGKVTRNTILRAYQSGDESLANAITDGTNTVVYSANASTEQADPYQHLQQCDPNGTEEFVSTGIVPVGHNTKYPDNLRMKLDNLPWNFANLIAPTESTFTATRNYTTGALLIVNNVLYKATANIANGATITVGTNVIATTLAEVIAALS